MNFVTRRRWVVSYTPRPIYPSTHWTESGVGPTAGLDALGRR